VPTFDGRDRVFDVDDEAGEAPPKRVLRHPFPVRDQGAVPCCVSIAVATCMEVLDAQTGQAVELSPLYHYWFARTNPESLSLLDPRSAFQTAVATGICTRVLHDPRFDEAGAAARPSDEAIEDARQHRLIDYDRRTLRRRYSLITGDAVDAGRRAVARGYPVLIAMWATSSYHSLEHSRRHGSVPAEPSSEGHAVVILGYNDDLEAFLIKDSRGPAWGHDGYWEMPYAVTRSRLIYEAWVLESINYDT
jgi:hypothetical protein